jgi:hypothetical protein
MERERERETGERRRETENREEETKCRGPNKAPFPPAFAPFVELWNGCSYSTGISRTDHGTFTPRCEIYSPPQR